VDLAGFQGVSIYTLEESLSAMAVGDVLGLARGSDYVCGVLEFCLGAPRGVDAVPAVGGADGFVDLSALEAADPLPW
jgi:hypothetical protein